MKKTLITCAVAVAALTSVAVAGGSAPAPNASQAGVYVEGMVGGTYLLGFKTFLDHYWINAPAKDWSHASWAWAVGADMGYQINSYWSAELGGFWTQKSNLKEQQNKVWYQHWLAYLAAKASVPVTNSFDLFAKFGVGINHWSWSRFIQEQSPEKIVNANGLGPVFAVGGTYRFGASHNLGLSLQYMRFGQSWSTFKILQQPLNAMDLVTLNLSYRFAV